MALLTQYKNVSLPDGAQFLKNLHSLIYFDNTLEQFFLTNLIKIYSLN